MHLKSDPMWPDNYYNILTRRVGDQLSIDLNVESCTDASITLIYSNVKLKCHPKPFFT